MQAHWPPPPRARPTANVWMADRRTAAEGRAAATVATAWNYVIRAGARRRAATAAAWPAGAGASILSMSAPNAPVSVGAAGGLRRNAGHACGAWTSWRGSNGSWHLVVVVLAAAPTPIRSQRTQARTNTPLAFYLVHMTQHFIVARISWKLSLRCPSVSRVIWLALGRAQPDCVTVGRWASTRWRTTSSGCRSTVVAAATAKWGGGGRSRTSAANWADTAGRS
jgi:hypothetical protein